MRTTLHTMLSFAFLVALSAPVWGQESTTKEGSTVRAKSILGAKVSVKGETSVGTVEDIVLSSEGVVDYLIVSQDGKLTTVPWEVAKFDYEKRTAVISIPIETYRKIPTYTVDRYPNFYAPTYREQIYGFYGVKPGAIRRLERRLDRR
jgi:hypothetical protein